MIDELSPLSDVLGLDMEGMPTADETAGIRAVTSAFKADLDFVGRRKGPVWKICRQAGQGLSSRRRDRRLPPHRWEGLVIVVGGTVEVADRPPGCVTITTRGAAQARTSEARRGRLEPPRRAAVMLDVLAIYRLGSRPAMRARESALVECSDILVA